LWVLKVLLGECGRGGSVVPYAGISFDVASAEGHIKRRGEGRRSSIARNARALISVDGIADWDETCENAFFGLGKFWFFRATMILCLNAEL
jgi:hypothetical protein